MQNNRLKRIAKLLSAALVLTVLTTGCVDEAALVQDRAAHNETVTAVTEGTLPASRTGQTPVARNGKLSVVGTNLCNSEGTPVQLKGVSTHGIAWFPQYINRDAFITLRDDWNADIIRLAMYTQEYGGYRSGGNREELKNKVKEGVNLCTELGLYCIVDWHILSDGNPNDSKEDAKAFFAEMSATYAGNNNVIYELCNEPNGGTNWNQIKQYADEVIPVIRANSPDAIILVGTPTWSQDVDQVAANPVANGHNVMYSLHFYAATHTDWIRNKLRTAHDAGTPVFVSECSICDASGNGNIDYNSAEQWMSLLSEYKVAYICWNLSNKSESSSVIASWCNKTSGWTEDELSETGRFFRNKMRQ